VEDVKVHKWMKKQVPDSKELGSGIIRVAFCSMCAMLCAWVIASSKVVRRPWTGLGILVYCSINRGRG
jgi:cytochrome bd-type quinol oxidase subunit 1